MYCEVVSISFLEGMKKYFLQSISKAFVARGRASLLPPPADTIQNPDTPQQSPSAEKFNQTKRNFSFNSSSAILHAIDCFARATGLELKERNYIGSNSNSSSHEGKNFH